MDRRRIEDLIKTIKRDLKLVRTRRAEQRRGRRRHGWVLVSIVGYTNAGKSTLIKVLSGAVIFDEGSIIIDGEEAVACEAGSYPEHG